MAALDRWQDALRNSGVGEDEIEERCKLLLAFCDFAELPPDDLVESCVDREQGKILAKKRKKVETLIDEFATAEGGSTRAATDRANVVRSFLIHNGVRVIAPKAPWL